MFDYLDWRGDMSFENAPINAVDLLIFATLSYCPLERMPGGFTPGTLAQLTAELYPPDAAFRNDAEKQRCRAVEDGGGERALRRGAGAGVRLSFRPGRGKAVFRHTVPAGRKDGCGGLSRHRFHRGGVEGGL